MRSPRKTFAPGALTLAEEAVHLLRRQGGAALAGYYLGSLPFVLALLYFWAEMSRSPFAQWYCAPAAAGVALLFIWMKLWQARFCRRLWTALQGLPPEPWPMRRSLATAGRQAAVHATGLVVLPLAALVALPLAWTYAFYQNASVLDDPADQGLRGLCKAAARQAALWPGQNHVLLSIFSAFALCVFGNLGIVLWGLPYLLKSLLGWETILTLSGYHLMNTTFLAVVCTLTYLCVDPVIKAAYVLRCYYGLSRHTGDDLRAALKPYLRLSAIGLVLWVGTTFGALAQAGHPSPPPLDARETIRRLDASIERVLQERKFTWRLPRDDAQRPPERERWFSPFLQWVGDGLAPVGRALDRWIQALIDWLTEQAPGPDPDKPAQHRKWAEIIRLCVYVLGGGLAIFLLILALRWWRRKRAREAPPVAPSAPAEIDWTDEQVTADELPPDRWLALARELMGKQDFRRALRAFYLAVLALLAGHGRLDIARHKSNRDYFRELARRGHSEPELMQLFDRCINAFERAWYGLHAVERSHVEQFAAYHERMSALVRQ